MKNLLMMLMAGLLWGAMTSQAEADTSWMRGSFGVSFHWTAKIAEQYGNQDWETVVNAFDVPTFADAVESFGAKHVIFTVAHAWQKLPCPCAALDQILPGRTTTRDLLQEIIDELSKRQIRVVFYYNHSCNHDEDEAWETASGFNDIVDAASMAAYAGKVCGIVRELSLRYKTGISAWWFDSASSLVKGNGSGAAFPDGVAFPFEDYLAAARAGNPQAAVTLNWDVGDVDTRGYSVDYIPGESEKIDAYGNCFPFAPAGLQDHVWTRMDSSDWFWQGREVSTYGSRFTEADLAWWRASHAAAGRMATLNLVIDPAGNINPVVAEQLRHTVTVGKTWTRGRYDPTTWQPAPAASNLVLNVAGEFTGNRSGTNGSYHDTPTTVLTDGTLPTTEIVAGANLNDIARQIFGSKDEGGVFAWTLPQASDVYGLNLYTRSSRSPYNGAKDGGNDAIVVTKVEVLPAGKTEWVDINAPAISFGKQDGISGGALMAKLADGTGAPLARNVTAIRFVQGAPENNTSLLVECEVLGCATEGGADPEPDPEPDPDPDPEPEPEPEPEPQPDPGDPGAAVLTEPTSMKSWVLKRVSTPAAKPTITSPQSWSSQAISGLYTADPTDKYSTLAATAGEITMTFETPVVANVIELFAPKDNVDQMASAFTVQGSNDGTAWMTLVSVSEQTGWFIRECRYYKFPNETAYAQYKLSVTATAGGASLRLGVFNYFYATAPDPTTPWVWKSDKTLSRGDQKFTNVSDKGTYLNLDYSDNANNASLYDLDFTAGFVDVNGAAIAKPLRLGGGLKGSAYVTRLVAPRGVDQIGDWGLESCYCLNTVALGRDFTTFGKGAFKKMCSWQYADFSSLAAETLPNELFMSCVNLKGELVFPKVKAFLCQLQSTRVTAISLPALETLGFDNSWVAPFGNNSLLTSVTLGPNLATIAGGQGFGKIKPEGTATAVYWRSVPPTFTYASPSLHGESTKNAVVHFLPWHQREQWRAFAASNTYGFSLSLPAEFEGEGTWKGSGSDELVRWWKDPNVKKGLLVVAR